MTVSCSINCYISVFMLSVLRFVAGRVSYLHTIKLIIFACLIVVACLTLPAAVVASDTGAETLHSGDKLKLEVFGHPDLSAEIEISSTNTATLPLLGIIATEGKTIENLREEIRQKLDKDYIVEPKVNLDRISQEPFYILGQVKNPGTYPFRTDMDVRKAVAIAGGFTSRANQEELLIVRKSEKIEATPDSILKPGDTLEVKLRWF